MFVANGKIKNFFINLKILNINYRLKDGREIELIARIRVQQRTIEGFTTSELIIDNVVPEDAGKYTVVVENIAGTDRCEANLTVIGIFYFL